MWKDILKKQAGAKMPDVVHRVIKWAEIAGAVVQHHEALIPSEHYIEIEFNSPAERKLFMNGNYAFENIKDEEKNANGKYIIVIKIADNLGTKQAETPENYVEIDDDKTGTTFGEYYGGD